MNARWWKSFGSRNTKCLNQPYQYLTIKSIVDKCGEHFNICLIDDKSFEKLIPRLENKYVYFILPNKRKNERDWISENIIYVWRYASSKHIYMF